MTAPDGSIEPPTSHLSPCVRVLGAVELGPRADPVEPRGKLLRLLGTLIASANEAVSISRLYEAVWDEEPPPTAESGIRGHVRRARQILERAGCAADIVAHPWGDESGYRLAIAVDAVDHLVFDALVTDTPPTVRDEVAQLETALSMWGGQPFGGLEIFAVLPLRAQLEEQRIAATERLAHLLTIDGRSDRAIELLMPLNARLPGREQLAVETMRALYAQSRQVEALAIGRTTADLLLERHGLDPTGPLAEMQRRILDHDPTIVPGIESVTDVRVPDSMAPYLTGPFVGRADLLQIGTGAAEQVSAGGAAAVLYTGPAGVGKTRLLAEIARRSSEAGVRCLHVAADPDAPAPLQLVRGAARQLMSSPDRPVASAATDLAGLIDGRTPTAPGQEFGVALDAATATLLDAIGSADRPVMVMFDDLQWADSASLAFLRRVVKSGTSRLGVVLSARSGSQGRAWDDFVAELSSTPIAAHFAGALQPADIEEWIADIDLDPGVPIGTVAAAVHRQTDGIPFFVEGVLDDLARSPGPFGSIRRLHEGVLPDRLVDPLRARIARLDDSDIRLLAVAAVASPNPDPTDVATICRAIFGPGQWVIDERRCQGLVRPDPDRPGRFVFEHAMTRTALRGLLTRDERRLAHRAAAEQRLQEGRPLADVAFHLFQAVPLVDAKQAKQAVVEAAAAAAALTAYEEAVVLYQRALALHADEDEPDPIVEIDLRIELSRAAQHLGAREEALPYLRTTLAQAEALGRWDKVADCALAAADFGEVLQRSDPVRSFLDRALAALPRDHATRPLVASESIIKRSIVEGASDGVTSIFDTELEGRRLDPNGRRERDRAWLHMTAGSPNAHERRRTAAALRSQCADQPSGRQWLDATLFLLSAELELGDTDAAIALSDSYALAAHRSGRPGVRWLAMVTEADLAQLRGDLTTARSRAIHALEFGTEHAVPDASSSYGGHALVTALLTGTIDRFAARALAADAEGDFVTPVLAAANAVLRASIGDIERATDVLARAVIELDDAPTSTLTPFALCLCAEAWIRCDRPPEHRDVLRERLLPYGGTMSRMALVGSSLGPIDRYLGALAAGHDEDEADRLLAASADLARRAGAPIWEFVSAVEWLDVTGSAAARQRVSALAQNNSRGSTSARAVSYAAVTPPRQNLPDGR